MKRNRASTPTSHSAPIAFATALTLGLTLWLQVLHTLLGHHESGEPPFLLHWLRDSTLALPLIAASVLIAGALVERLIGSGVIARRLRVAPLAAAIATGATAAFGVESSAHRFLFSAPSAQELSAAATAAQDMFLVFPAALVISLLVAARAVRGRPHEVNPRTRAKRWVANVVTAAVALPSIAAPMGAGTPARAATAPLPCPAKAQIKRFDVVALDVDIPLNRFGDHDPRGKMFVLAQRVDNVRAEEASQRVSLGLRDDAIQPLVIRANMGDCVLIKLRNEASGGNYGIHIDGLLHGTESFGDEIGRNDPSGTPRGGTRTYRYWVPRNKEVEGAHYLHPGPGFRSAVNNGLFGALVVEPRGSVYLHPETLRPIRSGWEAVIVPGNGDPAFREAAQVFHEYGDEDDTSEPGEQAVFTKNDEPMEEVGDLSGSYRPGSRAINYRSEPFENRLQLDTRLKSGAYGSYGFGDPSTPIPRGYLGDPTKFRILNAGSEIFHVYHLHGGGIRWRQNPHADPTYDYGDTGLDKHPATKNSPSTRLDSQTFGPGEAYDLQIEGGAGGVQQSAGDFLFHCHIAHHYVSGMWAFWRVFDTRQPGLAPLPDRAPPPRAVDSAGLIGRTMPDGTKLTRSNLGEWIRPQLPPRGVPRNDQDATVWDWSIKSTKRGPVYLGEPEEPNPWPNLRVINGHRGAMPGDKFVGNRPRIRFNPINGRPAYPLLRPHAGERPPFSPNGHSGAPWLGQRGGKAKDGSVDPWARRPDGICPRGSKLRRFNIVAVEKPAVVAEGRGPDVDATIFALAHDKADIDAGRKPVQPLAIRANYGDCVATTLTSEMTDTPDREEPEEPDPLEPPEPLEPPFDKVNTHIHHVQFDVQASDGVNTGLAFEQSVRPYKLEDTQLIAAAAAGAKQLQLANASKYRPGVWIGVGLGTESIEVHEIAGIDAATGTVTLSTPLQRAHAAGQWAGVEFVQARWYPDVALDNIFFHDHVDGIKSWGHGLVGQLIVEPPGSTYHDPVTGEQVDSGTIVDIHTRNPLVPGAVEGSFRELALWTIDDNPITDSTLNLRAEPWSERLLDNADPSLLFSSYTHGDPNTPLARAYPGDPFVIRTINTGPNVDTLHVDGHRFFMENRYVEMGEIASTPTDTLLTGTSERYTLILEGGAGGPRRVPGDYLYMNGLGRRFREGAWGILRVLRGRVPDLQELPGTSIGGSGDMPPGGTGARPPASPGPGNPCPATAARRNFDVSAVEVFADRDGARLAFVPTEMAARVEAGAVRPEPLVLHAAAGDCVTVRVTNRDAVDRLSFHLSELQKDIGSGGINVGYNPEQTVADGGTRTYRFYADTETIGAAIISDFGGDLVDPPMPGEEFEPDPDTALKGLYGAIVIAPEGARFTDPRTGSPTAVGSRVDVHVPGMRDYRDFTLALAEQDEKIGSDDMPYRKEARDPVLVNYRSADRPDGVGAFSSRLWGDPPTPILRAYAGDPMRVHAYIAPGSEQVHAFNLGGMTWPVDPVLDHSNQISTIGLGPWQAADAHILGGAGGRNRTVGDFFYGDLRRPFQQRGMWGLVRVLSDPTCPIRPLGEGFGCKGKPPLGVDETRPRIRLSRKPPAFTTGRVVRFRLASSEPVTYRCSLSRGGARFRSCRPRVRYRRLAPGRYTFKARATDRFANVSRTVTHRFTVDRTAPRVRRPAVAPEPFDPGPRKARIRTRVNEPSRVQFSIRRRGRLIRRLRAVRVRRAGRVVVTWNGRNDLGRLVRGRRYRAKVRAVDRAGNGATASRWFRVIR